MYLKQSVANSEKVCSYRDNQLVHGANSKLLKKRIVHVFQSHKMSQVVNQFVVTLIQDLTYWVNDIKL